MKNNLLQNLLNCCSEMEWCRKNPHPSGIHIVGELDWHQEFVRLKKEHQSMNPKLMFIDLQEANDKRVGLFKTRLGTIAHAKADGSDWSIAEWTNAAVGEMGEACNIAKKIRRGDFANSPQVGKEALAAEMADVIIYLSLCYSQIGMDMGEAVKKTFNKKSKDIGVEIFL